MILVPVGISDFLALRFLSHFKYPILVFILLMQVILFKDTILPVNLKYILNTNYPLDVAKFPLTSPLPIIGDYFKKVASPGDWLSVKANGMIPYFSGLNTIDALGLTDYHIARSNYTLGNRSGPGHEKHDINYVLNRSPRFIHVHNGNEIPGLPFPLPLSLKPEDKERYTEEEYRLLTTLFKKYSLKRVELRFSEVPKFIANSPEENRRFFKPFPLYYFELKPEQETFEVPRP